MSMKKRRDSERLLILLEKLEAFKKGELDLLELTQILNGLTSSLESFDEKWYWEFKKLWGYLEAIYYSAASAGLVSGAYLDEDATEIKIRIQKMEDVINFELFKLQLHRCPACGYDTSDSEVWSEVTSTFDLCDCCGMKYGKDKPMLEEVKRYRDAWLQHPTLWHNPKALPPNWKIEDQMENIPLEYL